MEVVNPMWCFSCTRQIKSMFSRYYLQWLMWDYLDQYGQVRQTSLHKSASIKTPVDRIWDWSHCPIGFEDCFLDTAQHISCSRDNAWVFHRSCIVSLFWVFTIPRPQNVEWSCWELYAGIQQKVNWLFYNNIFNMCIPIEYNRPVPLTRILSERYNLLSYCQYPLVRNANVSYLEVMEFIRLHIYYENRFVSRHFVSCFKILISVCCAMKLQSNNQCNILIY